MLDRPTQAALLQLARQAIAAELAGQTLAAPAEADWPARLWQPGASFVTLKMGSALRGCIGQIDANTPLIETIRDNALGAAFRDPRFPPLSSSELPRLTIEISILGTPRDIDFNDCRELATLLQPGEDGLILSAAGHRGVFLPQVWETLPEPQAFILQLKRKAHIDEDLEPPALRAQRFQVEHFEEQD